MFEGYIAGKFANKMFEKEVFQTIKKHALVGALLMMFPDFGFGTIIFVVVLWHMYSSICDKVGISFSDHFWKLVGVGIIVNIFVALIIDIVFTVLFFLEGFIMYFQFYMSGKMFVESIKNLDIKTVQQNNNINALPAHPAKITVTLNSLGFSTFACENALDLTQIKDLKAWQVTGISGESIKCSPITIPVAAGTGILLTGTPGAHYTLLPAPSGADISGTNKLKGITKNTRIAGYEYYGLSDNSFVPLCAGMIPSGKALLTAQSVNCEVKSYTIIFETSDDSIPAKVGECI